MYLLMYHALTNRVIYYDTQTFRVPLHERVLDLIEIYTKNG